MVNDGLLGLLGLQLEVTQLKVTSKEEEWKVGRGIGRRKSS